VALNQKQEELRPFSPEAKSFQVGQIYEHYKGNRYQILSVARHTETLEEVVVYQQLYGAHEIWVRPLKMFLENIVIGEETMPRFKKIR